jgi:hypothetical protein
VQADLLRDMIGTPDFPKKPTSDLS